MVFDYSQYVEVVAKESCAVASAYVPSHDDIVRLEQKGSFHFNSAREYSNLLEERVALFDAIELNTIVSWYGETGLNFLKIGIITKADKKKG